MLRLVRAIFVAMLMVLPCAVFAQPAVEPTTGASLPDEVNAFTLPDTAPKVDTARMALTPEGQAHQMLSPKKERRMVLPKGAPLSSDTTRRSRIFRFSVDRFTNDIQMVNLDTSLFYFRTDYPFFRADVNALFLGSLGSPVMYYDYFKRSRDEEFLFVQPYNAYFFSPTNVSFYNTTTPYTVLYYDWAGSKSEMEDQLRVLHAQNITHDLSFILQYTSMGTVGMYPRQHILNRAFNGGVSYLGQYYKANIGYIFNNVEAQENGGITDDWTITDTVVDPHLQTVRLQNAKSHVRTHRFYLTHSLDLPLFYFGNDSVINNVLIGRLGHSLEYSTFSKVYSDNATDTSYYANYYFGSANTRDSIGLRNFENKVFVQLRPLRAYIFESLTAGIGYRSLQSYMFNPEMYLSGASHTWNRTIYTYAAISAWYKQYFKWNFFGEWNFLGLSDYKSGDYKLGGDLTLSAYPIKKGIHLKVSLLAAGYSPDMFLQNYSTNNYRWNNKFEKNDEQRLEATLAVPALNLELGAGQSVHHNLIYFGDTVVPQQYSPALSITSFTLNHQLSLGSFNFNHRALVQLSSNQNIVSLPLLSISGSYYFEHDIVKKVLRMQLGIDWQYSTGFNGYAYNPSVGMFYNSSVQQGNYLWADAFIAFRWKRATPFIKCEHVNQGLLDWNTNYFSAVHYPRNARVFKFGLSWKFFD